MLRALHRVCFSEDGKEQDIVYTEVISLTHFFLKTGEGDNSGQVIKPDGFENQPKIVI